MNDDLKLITDLYVKKVRIKMDLRRELSNIHSKMGYIHCADYGRTTGLIQRTEFNCIDDFSIKVKDYCPNCTRFYNASGRARTILQHLKTTSYKITCACKRVIKHEIDIDIKPTDFIEEIIAKSLVQKYKIRKEIGVIKRLQEKLVYKGYLCNCDLHGSLNRKSKHLYKVPCARCFYRFQIKSLVKSQSTISSRITRNVKKLD